MNSRSVLAALCAIALSGCGSAPLLNAGMSDGELMQVTDVDTVSYVFPFKEVYRGEYELKKVGSVTAMYGKGFLGAGKDEGRQWSFLFWHSEKETPGGNSLAAGMVQGLTDSLSKSGMKVVGPAALSKLKSIGEMGASGGVGHAPGSRDVGKGPSGFGSTIFTADDIMSAAAREADVDVLFFVWAGRTKAELDVIVPYANMRVAGGSDRTYPVEFNHARSVKIDYSTKSGKVAGDNGEEHGKAIGKLLARRFRIFYPGSGSPAPSAKKPSAPSKAAAGK